MIIKKVIYFVLILICSSIFAQRETENWYFGNFSSLNFSSKNVTILNDSEMIAEKGSATISDKLGNLLFYTNGLNVFNKNHIKVQGVEKLESDNQTSQNTIIVPKPGSNTLFYIFTIKTVEDDDSLPLLPKTSRNTSLGLYYSVLDISKNNNLGEIIEGNVQILENTAQKISAVHHKNGKDIWIVTHTKDNDDPIKFNTFQSLLVTASGVQKIRESDLGELYISDPKGYLKFSPNGEFLALATNTSGVIVFKFNAETGELTNPERLVLIDALEIGLIISAYGVAFSKDSKKLYFHANKSRGGSRLYQFDTDIIFRDPSLANFIDIEKNAGALQLARDGNIYNAVNTGDDFKSGEHFLNIIENPEQDSFNFIQNKIDLSTVDNGRVSESLSRLGLPNFIQSYFRTRIISKIGCVDVDFRAIVDTYTQIDSAIWDFGDGNLSNEIEPIHRYQAPGKYILKANIILNGFPLELEEEIEIFPFQKLFENQKIIQCNSGGVENLFNLTEIENKVSNNPELYTFEYFKNEDDAIRGEHIIEDYTEYKSNISSEKLYVKSTNDIGCSDIVSFTLELASVNIGNIANNFICGSDIDESGNSIGVFDIEQKIAEIRNTFNLNNNIKLTFYNSFINAQTLKDQLTGDHSTKSGKIWVRADNSDGCGGIESFEVTVNDTPKITIQENYVICFNPSLKPPVVVGADASNERFEWRSASGEILSTSQDFTLKTTGEFSLTVYKNQNGLLCSNSKSFIVSNPEKPVFSKIIVDVEDESNNSLEVLVDGNSSYEFSLDNINFIGNGLSHTFINIDAGLRTVYVRDIDNCEEPIETKASVIGFKKYFTPNGDNNNDYWNVIGLDASSFKSFQVTIFDRYGKITGAITNFNSQGWDGTYNGKKLSTNDFWFTATIIDNDDNIIKKTGNFSLIRN